MATTPYIRNLDPLRGLKCPACGYELTGLSSSVCPKCGSVYEDALAVKTQARRRSYSRARTMASAASTAVVLFLSFGDARSLARYAGGWCGTPSLMVMQFHWVILPIFLMLPLHSWLKCRSDPTFGFLTRWFLGAGLTAWIGVPAIIKLFNALHP